MTVETFMGYLVGFSLGLFAGAVIATWAMPTPEKHIAELISFGDVDCRPIQFEDAMRCGFNLERR